MKKLHIGLLPRILIAIAFGILFGNFLPGELVRLFVTFNGIFSEFLNFSIPLIIVGLVTVAIADIGKGAGETAVDYRTDSLRGNPVFRFPLLLYRSNYISSSDRVRCPAGRGQRSARDIAVFLMSPSTAHECDDGTGTGFHFRAGTCPTEKRYTEECST